MTGEATRSRSAIRRRPLDKAKAKLTHRVHLDDVPRASPGDRLGIRTTPTGTAIRLVGGSTFVANDIYEFSYTAKDPTVNGLGFAAVRDWNAWLRFEATDDDFGTANPLAGDIQRIYTEISSQPGRFLNDFRHLGFNQAENGKKVFDGLMQWIAAGRRHQPELPLLAARTAPSATARTTCYVEGVFPFANVPTTDPFTGKIDSRYAKCERDQHLPAGGRDLFGQRVLGEGGIAAAHRLPTGTGRPARLAVRAQLPHLEPPARHRQRRPARAIASSSRIR